MPISPELPDFNQSELVLPQGPLGDAEQELNNTDLADAKNLGLFGRSLDIFKDVRRAANEDEAKISRRSRFVGRLSLASVGLGYAYQGTIGPAISIAAGLEGYSHNGAVGAIGLSTGLGLFVGAQQFVTGRIATNAMPHYPSVSETFRRRFPRINSKIAQAWAVNQNPRDRAAVIATLGTMSAVINESAIANPDISKRDLRRFSDKAAVQGTAYTTTIGLGVGAIGKTLQAANHYSSVGFVDLLNSGFDREVVNQPVRVAYGITALMLGKTYFRIKRAE